MTTTTKGPGTGLWAAALLLCHHTGSAAMTPQQVYAAVAPSVAALQTVDEQGSPIAQFSATQVGATRYVTVCDGVDAAPALRLRQGEASASARIGARDRERNLCLVEAAQAIGPALTLHAALPATGQRVFAISNALGLGVGISEGVVAGIRSLSPGRLVQFTAPVSPGSEGGALVDDQGRLLAILDYRRRDGQNVNFGSPAAWIAEIAPRADGAAAQLQRFDAAAALSRQEQWQALADHAAAWLVHQPEQPDALRFAIEAAQALGQPDAVLGGWRALRRIKPDDAPTGLGLGGALWGSGLRAEALALARQLVAEHAEDGRVQLFLARVLRASGALADAESAYRRAIGLDAWLTDAYLGLATLAQARNDTATAVSIWSRLSGLYPQELQYREGLVRTSMRAGRPRDALAELDRWPAPHKDSATASLWRAEVLLELGAPEAALQAARQGLARGVDSPAIAWTLSATALARLQRHPEAIAAIGQAVALDPGNAARARRQVHFLFDGGQAQEALRAAQALADSHPDQAELLGEYGRALVRSDRHADAVPVLERALQADARQPFVWRALVRAHQNLGQRQQARAAHARLREIDAAQADDVWRSFVQPFEEGRP